MGLVMSGNETDHWHDGQVHKNNQKLRDQVARLKIDLEEAQKWEESYYAIASDLLDWKERAERAEEKLVYYGLKG